MLETDEKQRSEAEASEAGANGEHHSVPDVERILRDHMQAQRVARRFHVQRHLTDSGNAERFADHWNEVARFDGTAKVTLIWDSRKWTPDSRNLWYFMAKQTVRAIYREAELAEHESDRKAIADHAKRSESAQRIDSMVRLAKAAPELATTSDVFDRDPDSLNVGNGIVDLRTGELRDHDPAEGHSKIAGASFEPAMLDIGEDNLPRYFDAAPHFFSFLTDIAMGRVDWIHWMQRLIGYASTGHCTEQIAAFLVGAGSNGKGTLTELLLHVLGEYATTDSPELMVNAKPGSGPSPEVARLKGVRLLSIQETESDARLSEARFKWLTGGDTLTGRFLYGNLIEFSPNFTPILSTNHEPRVSTGGHSVWRRVRLVPFDFQARGDAVDRHLAAKLRAERDAVLAWIIDGARKWYAEGMPASKTVDAATAQYKADEDRLAPFLAECIEHRKTDSAKCSDLYRRYREWCESQADRPMSNKAFRGGMKERGYEIEHTRTGDVYVDIRIR